MEKVEHTPGPWEVWTENAEVFANVTENTPDSITGMKIAECDSFDIELPDISDTEEADEAARRIAQANAYLIAAAPELLHVAVDLMARLKLVDDVDVRVGEHVGACEAIQRAEAAIRKARGGNNG